MNIGRHVGRSCRPDWKAFTCHRSRDYRWVEIGANVVCVRVPSRSQCVVCSTLHSQQTVGGSAGISVPLKEAGEEISDADPRVAEELEELQLYKSKKAEIYGIPRSEWLKLNTPARYLGNEFGAVRKSWNSARIRFCLSYPELYEVGASNLGHIILYGLLNQEEGLLCDRTYYPADDMKDLLRRFQKPLFGVESQKGLRDFDCLGFSLSYELGGTNILDMLHVSGIPVTWKERREDPGIPFDPAGGSPPLVFAGGPTATSNPEPFADFFDFFALGDGEELLPEIGRCLQECRADGLDRESTLLRLALEVDGVYVPQVSRNM